MPNESSEATSRRWNLACATNALGDLVVPTVDEEERAFLGAQNTRATTIEMAEKPVAEDEGVLRRDRPRALRARRGLLFRHWSIPMRKRERMGLLPGGTTPARVTPDAPVVGEREDSTSGPSFRSILPQRLPRRALGRVLRVSSSSSFVPRLDRCLKLVEIHVFHVRAAQFLAVSFVQSVETNGVEDLPNGRPSRRTRINVPSAAVLSTLNVMAMRRSCWGCHAPRYFPACSLHLVRVRSRVAKKLTRQSQAVRT